MVETADEAPMELTDEPGDTPVEPQEGSEGDARPEDDTPPTPEPEPASAAPMSEKEIERAMASLAKEATRHANRISEIMGADAQELAPCPFCEPTMQGFYFPGTLDEEKVAAVLLALGVAGQSALKPDPETLTCDYCDGEGETLTGSKVPNMVTRPCPKCHGNGWVDQATEAEWVSREAAKKVSLGGNGAAASVPVTDEEVPASDPWGRPRGSEFYGRMPNYMKDAEKARDLPAIHGRPS